MSLVYVLLTYMLAVSTFLILPGPVNLFVANATLKYGFKGTFWSIFGTNVASIVLILIAGLLIASAETINALVLDLLTLFGGIFLIYYGITQVKQAVNHKNTPNNTIAESTQTHQSQAPFSIIKQVAQGFAIGISNPKDIIFFISFFPPFILKMGLSIPYSLLILTLVWCILDYTLLFLYGIFTQKFIKGTFEIIFAFASGIIFIGLGGYAIYLAAAALMPASI